MCVGGGGGRGKAGLRSGTACVHARVCVYSADLCNENSLEVSVIISSHSCHPKTLYQVFLLTFSDAGIDSRGMLYFSSNSMPTQRL